MHTDIRRIASRASRVLDTPIRLVLVDRPIPEAEMNATEFARYAALRGTRLAMPWRLGRAALKRLLRELRRDPDTAAITFPNGTCSLSHTAGLAVAAGSGATLRGIGVDIELRSQLRVDAARFFLKPHEQRWVAATGTATRVAAGTVASGAGAAGTHADRHEAARLGHQLVRLWTIKEAVFKADPGNEGALLYDYDIAQPQLRCGVARSPSGGWVKYGSWPFGAGFLSVAVAGAGCA